MAAKIFRINYKSDFILTMNSDAGWAIPFCIKFWTSVPSRAYFVGFDGTTYTHCAYDPSEPTKLVVQFDDHHLPIGDLNYQIAYHFTVDDFPNDTEDEVINPAAITTEIDGETYNVMLDFTGETAPEIEFNLPAYANEQQRIQNELQRQQNEAERIAAELQREQATAAAVQGAENVNAQLAGNILTVTNRNGVSTSVNTKGEQGEQGPVGPEGPQGEQGVSIVSFTPKSETSTTLIYTATFSDGTTQDVAIPKGAKGDTGATGPQGPQGDTGVSITGMVETGETTTATLYNITFSNGTTQQVAIPKGEKGDTGEQGPVGPQGPQGPMGDVAVITPEQQAAFTMYSTTGQNTNGPMTQKAVTDNLVANAISYDNSQSGLSATNVQDGIDELSQDVAEIKDDFSREMQMYLVNPLILSRNAAGYIDTPINLEPSAKYRFHFELTNTASQNIGFYLRESASHSSQLTSLGVIKSGDNSADIFFETDENNAKQYLSWWNGASEIYYCKISIYRIKDIDLDEMYSEIFVDKYDHTFILGGISHGVDNNNAIAIKTDYISINQELRVNLSTAQGIPSAYSQWLVFYKDGIFVRSEELAISAWFTISPSNDYNQVRIQLIRNSECTESQASNSHAFITPSSKISRIDNIEQEVDDLKNSGGVSSISVSASDLSIDLTNEVLDLSNVSATNYKYNGTSAVTNNNWRLINNVLPAKAGVYYVVDNNGNMIKSQIAYVNNNGDILKVHGTDFGSSNNMISNYYIDTLEATGLRIAINATSLSGLHITNGRKFIITDNAKRAAFDMLCSDGRINVGFIEAATASERIILGLKMAGDFGVVYIPSGRYEITSCIWAGVGAQSIEMESDTLLVASDSFTDDYLIEWSYSAIDTDDPEWANTFGESSSLVAAHITGGLFDVRGKGGCLRVYSFRGFEIHSCHFYNSSTKAVSIERPGFELVMHDCSARNDIKGLADNIGFNLACNDCHYHDLICVNYKYGFKVSQLALLDRCHPWLGRLDQTTYYNGSIGFDLADSHGSVLVNCYSDGMQTHYKTGAGVKLIGCTVLSAVTSHWDPRPYGNINIVDNEYPNVVLIGCNYRAIGGAILTKNAGSVAIQEIGCTAY